MPSVATPQTRCRAGVARIDITPPVGIYHRMWGAAKHDRSTGIHRPLNATALALSPLSTSSHSAAAHETLLVLGVDHCLLWGREMQVLLDRLVAGAGVPRERIVVAFSHTHGAGLLGLERASLPGGDLIPPYLDALAERLIEIARSALRDAVPATIVYGTGHCDLARHRDLWDNDTLQWVCGFHPGGKADDTVGVARITSDASDTTPAKTLATVVNYACHPTTLAWDNTLISPDFIGAMREVIEAETHAPCLFLQGASGDLGPRDGFVGDTAVADRNGRQLGFAALAAITPLPPPLTRHEYRGPVVSGATIGVWQHVPLEAAQQTKLARWQVESFAVELPLRDDLPNREQADAQIAQLTQHERDALSRGEESVARDYRAQIERLTRWLVRLATLPPGKTCSVPITLARLGDADWLFLESEHYQRLQTSLRARFADRPLFVTTIVNGSVHTYLPPREVYGTGIYQETVAVLAPGCLETVIDAIGARLQSRPATGA